MMNQNWGMSMPQMSGTCPTCGCGMHSSQMMGNAGWMGTAPGMGMSGGPGMGWGGFAPSGFQGGMPSGMGWGGQWGMQPGMMGTFTPTDYFTGTIPDDDQLREMVYESLDADPSIPSDADINVEVNGGIVTLNGTVPNKRVKHAAGDDAWWIPSVIDVNNRLEVRGRRERARGQGGTTEMGAETGTRTMRTGRTRS